MLTKNQVKWILSFSQKKVRDTENSFVAEGDKLVGDLLPLMHCRFLVATSDFLSAHASLLTADVIIETTKEDVCRASQLNAPQSVVAVFSKPDAEIRNENFGNGLTIVLDRIQDPGNLGTIVRIADWFGIKRIVCSNDTADVFNCKTVQATMGAVGRVKVFYVDVVDFLKSQPKNLPVYGTFLEGENIYNSSLTDNGFIIMGNERKGVSAEVAKLVNKKLFIPNYPKDSETSESLNVAVATAITCSEFRRRMV